MDKQIGLVGLGLLGSALAQRWLDAGYQVWGYDVVSSQRASLVARGGKVVGDLSELAAQQPVIVLCLPHSESVAQVSQSLWDVGWPGPRAGALIDTTTGSPEVTESLAHLWESRDVPWIDAAVAGSSVQVTQGEATILLGGSLSGANMYREVVAALGCPVLHTGGTGSAAKTKLVVNLALGLHRAVLAEALSLAHGLDLDLSATLDILRATPAYSRVMDTKGRQMVSRQFTPPQARLAQHLKDVELMLEVSRRTHCNVPLTEVHRARLAARVAAGDGELDNSAILRAWLADSPPTNTGSSDR